MTVLPKNPYFWVVLDRTGASTVHDDEYGSQYGSQYGIKNKQMVGAVAPIGATAPVYT